MTSFNAGSIVATLKANVDGFKSDLRIASNSVKEFSSKSTPFLSSISNGFTNVRNQINQFSGVLSTVAIGAFVNDLKNIAVELEGVRNAFNNFFGSTAQNNLKKYQEATRGTVSEINLMKAANQAMLLGIDPELLPKMFEGALIAAQATGQPISQAINDITTGVGRQSKLILDNLGIMVNTEGAYNNFALSVGKVASELTEQEKKLAFTNAVMEGLANNAERVGGAQENLATATQRSAAEFENAKALLSEEMVPVFTKVAEALTYITRTMVEAAGIVSTEFSSLIDLVSLRYNTFIQNVINLWNNMVITLQLAWIGLMTTIKNAVSSVVSVVTGLFSSFWQLTLNIWNTGSSLVLEAWNAALNAISNVTQAVFENIKNIFVGVINWIVDQINYLIGIANGVTKKLSFGTVSIPEIPRLASGGIVTRPTLAMIGEGGESEAVIPLSKLGNFGGGLTIQINDSIVSDEESARDLLSKAFNAMNLAT